MVRSMIYPYRSKYGAKKTNYEGINFDSKKEAKRYAELKVLEKAGMISDLELQKKYELIPEQREPDTLGPRGGMKKGKVIERACDYYADFVYTKTDTGETVVEDVKGMRTKEYRIKKKLMLYKHNIKIQEV